jgi:hypothetical protein
MFRIFYHDDSSVDFFIACDSMPWPASCCPTIHVKHASFDLEEQMLKTFIAGSVVTLLTATTGMAQPAGMKACGDDVKTLCAGVQPGDGRVKACIKSHFSDVSASCQAVLLKAAAISKACSADVKNVCADVKPGGGRIEACMKSHLSEISDPCKEAVTQAAAGKG